MADRSFGASTVIDRPVEEVFDFLAAGVNDPKFSPRVQEIEQAADGPVGAGTVFKSTVKDAGMTTQREFEYTEFERPSKLRWRENSKNMITVPDGGYDLEPAGDGKTKLSFFNTFDASGFGKLIVGFALRGARKDADGFVGRIKQAVESS